VNDSTVPVARAQDSAYNGAGTITLSPNDSTVIIGNGTTFVKDFSQSRWQIMLPRSLNSVSVEVVEVISDTEMRIKKEFPKKATESLRAKSDGTSYKVSLSLSNRF
jgi:glycerol-3-phosphate O-acyltransferase/dihydroxyacetone phosphate acyltransferase